MKGKKNLEIEKANQQFDFDVLLCEDNLNLQEYNKIDLKDIVSLGTNFIPIVETIKNFFSDGKSGLYYVDAGNNTLFNCQSGIGHRAGYMKETGGLGQSVLYHMPFDPIVLGIAITLNIVSSKLNKSIRLSSEILNFIELKEKSKLDGAVVTLNRVFNKYKIEGTSMSKIEIVSDIYGDAQGAIFFYSERLCVLLKKKQTNYMKIQEDFNCYKKSIFIFVYSTFLLEILEKHFSSESIDEDIKEIKNTFKEYVKIKNIIIGIDLKHKKNYLNFVGEKIAKLDSKIEFLPFYKKVATQKAHELHGFEDEFIKSCEDESFITTFVESIKKLKSTFNDKNKIVINKDSIYYLS